LLRAACRRRFAGVERVEIGPNGDLLLHTAAGLLRQEAPVAWQEAAGERTPVAARYSLASRGGEGESGREGAGQDTEVRLVLGEHDRTRRLVIDPLLVFGTYLGGTGPDRDWRMAVDAGGNVYLAGSTDSSDFPTASAAQASKAGFYDVFVSKLAADGGSLLYSTYLGGASSDSGQGIAVDADGNAYVVGWTVSTDFPTASPLQASSGGFEDAFLAKLAADGSLLFSTYLGGGNNEFGQDIAVDAGGNAYVTGWTLSTDFPTASPLQASNAGIFDAFVSKLAAGGGSLLFSTYLGGGGQDQGAAIAVDAGGHTYVTGFTRSTDFPTTSPLQASNAGDDDLFVSKLAAGDGSLLFSTYLGGGGQDRGTGIGVDAGSNVYVSGTTTSTDFPTRDPLQASNAGLVDGFVVEIGNVVAVPVLSTWMLALLALALAGAACHRLWRG